MPEALQKQELIKCTNGSAFKNVPQELNQTIDSSQVQMKLPGILLRIPRSIQVKTSSPCGDFLLG
jgi:hypothetical protein